ncbi:MAG: ABC transporter permease subunit [Tissierellia bacterium]|nr:ABC transporter permease subunit [Tissierellia bacterium]
MNIVKRELRANLKSTVIWFLAIAFIVGSGMMKFDSFSKNLQGIDILETMPESFTNSFAMAGLDLTKVQDMVAAMMFYIYLILGLHGLLLGNNIISKEERDKTSSFLYGLPRTRRQILWSKTIAGSFIVMGINILTFVVFYFMTKNHAQEIAHRNYLLHLALVVFFIQMIYYTLGILMASVIKSYKLSSNISLSLFILSFIIATLMNMVDQVDFLKIITPFQYFDAKEIWEQGGIDGKYIFLSMMIIAVQILLSFLFYPKRDLQ